MRGAGLCGVCRHGREVRGARGSVFLLCRLSRTDERFARYPRLPVWSCPGFREAGPRDDRSDESAGQTEEAP